MFAMNASFFPFDRPPLLRPATRWLVWATICLGLAAPMAAWGQQTNTFRFTINKPVPDANLGGVSNLQSISLPGTVTKVTVTLDLVGTGQGGVNGDMYAALTRNGSYPTAVLLNSPGRTAANSVGYTDNGLDFTFDDTAATDSHLYQTGTYTTDPTSGQVSGTFQPDGREGPRAKDTSSRTVMLSSFNGSLAGGNWLLFVSDTSAPPNGKTETVTDWSLTIVTVPEPSAASLCIVGLAAMSWLVFLKKKKS